MLGSDAKINVAHPRHSAEGISDEIVLDAESLRPVVDLSKIELVLKAEKKESGYVHNYVTIACSGNSEAVRMVAIDLESVQCLERIALNLGLEQRTRPKDSSTEAIEELKSRIAVLEKVTSAVERRLKCYVSFKFDDPKITAQVERLKRFLSAVGLEFVTGEQFEPRRIEDKVKARLRADVNFVVAVISKAGESKWIRDEVADANARGLSVILLLEDGATFDRGIFGTLEYIPYDLAIDQTFLALLEGINFIRAEVSQNPTTKTT